MKTVGTVKIHCISKTLSPLTHMMETAGNESIINRGKIFHKGIVKSIPVISGYGSGYGYGYGDGSGYGDGG